MKTMKHHVRRIRAKFSPAIDAVTDPARFAPVTGIAADRPNYQLVGLKAPHVYGFPDQDSDVRVADRTSTTPRRVDRNNMLHYDEREYKPMTMERKIRRF